MKKIILVLISLSTCFMVGFAGYSKSSYLPMIGLKDLNSNNPVVSYDAGPYKQYYYYNDSMDLDSLMNHSDAVVEVSCLNYGKQTAYSILRNCKVKRIIKGENIKKEGHIYIYEPTYISPYDEYPLVNGYINMKIHHTYILFLKKVNAPSRAPSMYSNAYYLTSPQYGKYRQGHYEQTTQINENCKYKDIQNHETILVDDKSVTLYNRILKSLEQL